MANIKSINGNPIVLDASGIADNSIPDSKLVQTGGVLSEAHDIKSAIMTPLVLGVSVIGDNPNTFIRNDGAVLTTVNPTGTSNAYYCKAGATISYRLSSQSGQLVFAVYDSSGNLTHSSTAGGFSSYVEEAYTFTDSDAYFRVCGVASEVYIDSYYLDYTYFPSNIVRKSVYDADMNEINVAINYSDQTEVKTLLTDSGGIKPDGTVNNASSVVTAYSRSDYIELKKGSTITYSGVRVTNLCAIAPYDTDKVFDSDYAVVAAAVISGVWTMPFDGYVRLSCRNTELDGDASFVILNATESEIVALDARILSLDERIDALEQAAPSGWETYLTTKRADVKSALVAIGDSGESFTFVTDCHVPRNNMLTPQIIRALDKDCQVNYHINGGDFIDINTDSAQSAINVLWQWKDAMYGMTEYAVRGNHDSNNYNGSNSDNALTVGQFYAIMDRQIENAVNTDGNTYYCIDNNSQKIRIIVLDSSLANKTDMYSWFNDKLTELDANWTILVIQHYLWGSTTDTIHESGQATIDAINNIYNQISAKLIGILAGHTHVDYDSIEPVNGYLLIARDTNMVKGGTGTDSLSFDYVTINTLAGTINFTKIGRGSNLSLSY